MKSYTKIYIMVVFAVKYRNALLTNPIRAKIHSLLATLVEAHGEGSKALAVGGTADHVHILLSLSPNIALSTLVREIKSRSSRWINNERLSLIRFEWQAGYGAFSYNQSLKDTVVNYIKNQEEHHRQKTFREELDDLLKKFQIIADPRDLPIEPI